MQHRLGCRPEAESGPLCTGQPGFCVPGASLQVMFKGTDSQTCRKKRVFGQVPSGVMSAGDECSGIPGSSRLKKTESGPHLVEKGSKFSQLRGVCKTPWKGIVFPASFSRTNTIFTVRRMLLVTCVCFSIYRAQP